MNQTRKAALDHIVTERKAAIFALHGANATYAMARAILNQHEEADLVVNLRGVHFPDVRFLSAHAGGRPELITAMLDRPDAVYFGRAPNSDAFLSFFSGPKSGPDAAAEGYVTLVIYEPRLDVSQVVYGPKDHVQAVASAYGLTWASLPNGRTWEKTAPRRTLLPVTFPETATGLSAVFEVYEQLRRDGYLNDGWIERVDAAFDHIAGGRWSSVLVDITEWREILDRMVP